MTGVPAKVKIVGERNSGTNLLEALFAAHGEVDIVPSTAPQAIGRAARLTKAEALTDLWFRVVDRHSGGWKHAHADRLLPSLSSPKLHEVALVIIVRDPWAWIPALNERPYHLGIGGRSLSMVEFLDTRLRVQRRESVDRRSRRPVELWNWKAAGYRLLDQTRQRTAVVTYEKLVLDCAGEFADLCRRLSINVRSPAVLPSRGVKAVDAQVTSGDYQRKLLDRTYLDRYDAMTLERVSSELDPQLLGHFGYSRDPNA